MEPSEHLKEYGRDKLSRLEKYLDSVLDADVTFSIEKFRHKTEVVLLSDGLKIKAEEETEDMYSSLDLVLDKLERQIKRHREKLKGHGKGQAVTKKASGGNGQASTKKASGGNGQAAKSKNDGSENDAVIADRTRDLTLNRMGLDEAAEILAHSKTPFVVFLDNQDGGLRLLHQQQSGTLELLRLHA
jgi:putative sigma-54 modulation protein